MADIKNRAMSNYLDNNLPKVILVDMYTPQINGARERMKQFAAELTADWEEEKRREEESEEEDEAGADVGSHGIEGMEDQDVHDGAVDGSIDGDEARVSPDPDDDEGPSGGSDGHEEAQDAGDDDHEGEDEVEDEVKEGVGGGVVVAEEPVRPNEIPAADVGLAEVGLLLGVAEVAHEKGNDGDSSSDDEPLHKQAPNAEFTSQKRKQNKATSGTSEFTPRKRTHKNSASETHPASDTPRPKRTRK
jgi:hypothetical protein